MKTDSLIADLIFGVIFSLLGYGFILKREKIVNALLASNKAFWGNIGFTPNEKKGVLLTNIMIPIMGIIFGVIGLMLLYRVITYFLK